MSQALKQNTKNSGGKSKLRRKRLSEQLTDQLCKHIVKKGLKPGDPLLTEQEMMKRFGVSRSVVREATKALDFLGIINAVPNRGMVLDKFDFERVSEYFGFHFALSDYPVEQLYEARMVLETGALYYTIRSMRQQPALYEELLKLAEAAPDDERSQAWMDYDIAFHRRLVEASGVGPLASFSDLLQAFFQKSRGALAISHDVKDMHVRIVEALNAGELNVATELLRNHTFWQDGGNQ
jgi:GntR family transcriptional regulator, transcriptional repressor for pyruvate dehydrogenase complex